MLKQIRNLDFDAIIANVERRVDRGKRDTGNGLMNNDLLWITSPESAIASLRDHVMLAALAHAKGLEDVRFDRLLVQALVRIQHHPLAPPVPPVRVQHGLQGPDAAPTLTAIVEAHPELTWDPEAIKQLILRELREVHGKHTLDDAEPPHLMHWGSGSAAAYALFLLVVLRALGEIK